MKNIQSLLKQALEADLLSESLDLLLTHQEQQVLENRLAIIKALVEQSQTQREIAEDLSLSISKITRGANALKTITPELRGFLQVYFQGGSSHG